MAVLSQEAQHGTGDFTSTHRPENWLCHLLCYHYFLVDWNVPLDELTNSFREWAKREQASLMSRPGRPPGKKAQWERLKWLAVFRLHNAGYNFPEARKLIEQRQLTYEVVVNAGAVFPIYGGDAAWGKVVSKVRIAVEGDVVGWIGASFGFADFS